MSDSPLLSKNSHPVKSDKIWLLGLLLACVLTTSLNISAITLQEATIVSVLPLWAHGATAIPLNYDYKPINIKNGTSPYSMCTGFYNCQRMLCNVATEPNVFWTAMFFEVISKDICQQINTNKLDTSVLPKLHTLTAYKVFTYLGLFSEIVMVTLCFVSVTIWLKLTLVSITGLGQIIGGVCWLVYLSDIRYMYGEDPPGYLTSLFVFFNVLTILSIFLSHTCLLFVLLYTKYMAQHDQGLYPVE